MVEWGWRNIIELNRKQVKNTFFSQEINKAFQEIYAETVEEFNMYYSIKCMAQFVMKNMNAISMKKRI